MLIEPRGSRLGKYGLNESIVSGDHRIKKNDSDVIIE